MVFFHISHSSLEWMAPELIMAQAFGSGSRRARSGELEAAGQDMNQQKLKKANQSVGFKQKLSASSRVFPDR